MTLLLPSVLAVRPRDEDSPSGPLVLDLHVPAELAHFSGHFPDLPILPGVVLVDWALHFAREQLRVTGEFWRLENVKFLAAVLPETRLQLELRHDPAQSRVEFTYAAGERRYASGRAVFRAAA